MSPYKRQIDFGLGLDHAKFQREEMTIKSFNREKLGAHVNRGDKRLIFRAKIGKEEGDLFFLRERLIYSSKSVHKTGEGVEIIGD